MKMLLGGILAAVGLVIACVSGLCTVVLGFGSFNTGYFFVPLLIGGVPFVAGVGLLVLGIKIADASRETDNKPSGPSTPSNE